MKMMKKTVALVLVLLVFCSCSFVLNACGEQKSTEFDENNIVLSFSAMSDVHQQKGHNEVTERLVNALKYAAQLNGKELDAAIFAGDLTENTWKNNDSANFSESYNADLAMFKTALETGVNLNNTAVIYALGNHDHDPTGNQGEEKMSKMPALFYEQLGKDFFRADTEMSIPEVGRRHAVVNGYNFIAIQPDRYWRLNGYSQETLDWLDSVLARVTAAEPEKYVFVMAHPPLYGTVFSSYRNDWADSDVLNVVKKYPQVLYFSGHLHNVLQDEVQISQNGYVTSVDCGSVKYTGAMNVMTDMGAEFDNSMGTVYSNGDFSQGLLVQVDASGNVRIIRCDYYNKRVIKQPWIISYPQADGSHLTAYDNDTRIKQNVAPSFDAGAKITATVINPSSVKIEWPSATDDDMVRFYRVILRNKNNPLVSETYNLATFVYRYASADEMPKTNEYELHASFNGEYTVEIYAFDVWSDKSKPITCSFAV